MPVPLAAKVGIAAVTVTVAAAIAVYESPELRRMADDLRRRIAVALHSLGDATAPQPRQPRFNRPEDADGFMQPGVDADDETRRRQREELMYWNAMRRLREEEEDEKRAMAESEKSAGAYNTGANFGAVDGANVRRRGVAGVTGLSAAVYANPFADENGIGFDEHDGTPAESHLLSPGPDESVADDMYNATPRMPSAEPASSRTMSLSPPPAPAPEVLFDFTTEDTPVEPMQFEPMHVEPMPAAASSPSTVALSTAAPSSATADDELAEDEYMTAGQEDRQDAYASIQAWAAGSGPSFYSPLPESPAAPLSEPELISEGALTPTGDDAMSVANSGEYLGDEAMSVGEGGLLGVMSDDEGIATPNSWSEVGSVISENDGPIPA